MKKEDLKYKFIELRAMGYTYERICKKLDITKPTAIKWAKSLSEEIAQQQKHFLRVREAPHQRQAQDRLARIGAKSARDVVKLFTGQETDQARHRAIANLDNLLARLDQALAGSEHDIAATLTNLRQTTENLRDLSESARHYPAGALFGEPPAPIKGKK